MNASTASRLPARTGTPAALILLITTIVIVFLFGGGARDDIRSLVFLRPITAMLFVAAVIGSLPGAWREHRVVVGLALAWTGLIVVHLIPLPPALWSSLPGRGVIADIYAGLRMPLPWLPLSIAPETTWNAAFAMMAPLAGLLFALTLRRDRLYVVLRVLLIIGFISGLVGLLQAINPERSGLYFYRITNDRSAVGLFANRNHQAVLLACMFPLLSAHLSLMTGRPEKLLLYKRLTLVAVGLLVPLVLVTGSRAGLVLGVVGLALALAVYRTPVPTGRVVKGQRMSGTHTVIAGVGVAIIAVVVIATSRASSVQRLMGDDVVGDLRTQVAPLLWNAMWTYFPFGSGIGSFVETYALIEPDRLLTSNYVNHAHNDVLELLLTGGVPALVLMIAAAVLYVVAAKKLVLPADRSVVGTPANILGKLGLTLILLLFAGSLADYPLRTPSLAVFAMVAVAFVAVGLRELAPTGGSGHSNGQSYGR